MSDTIGSVLETEIKRFDITEAVIEQMKADFAPLQIDGVEDREGYKKVHDARMLVREKRCEVERRRKLLKAPFLDAGEKIDMEAKRITKQLEPIEDELEAKEKAIDEERERIKEEERKREEARVKARFDKLQSVGAYLDLGVIKEMTDEGFEGYYEARKAEHEEAVKERQRIEKEAEEKQKAEALARKEEAEQKEAEAKRNEPMPEPIRPVTPAPQFAKDPLVMTKEDLEVCLTALCSAGYRNHQRALVEDPNFVAIRKISKGVIKLYL